MQQTQLSSLELSWWMAAVQITVLGKAREEECGNCEFVVLSSPKKLQRVKLHSRCSVCMNSLPLSFPLFAHISRPLPGTSEGTVTRTPSGRWGRTGPGHFTTIWHFSHTKRRPFNTGLCSSDLQLPHSEGKKLFFPSYTHESHVAWFDQTDSLFV